VNNAPAAAPSRAEILQIGQTNFWSCTMSNGWTPERRAGRAALIQNWQPWARSTGPKTEIGKAASAGNSRTHGMRSRRAIDERRTMRALIREWGGTAG
jgi:hypothetical protein